MVKILVDDVMADTVRLVFGDDDGTDCFPVGRWLSEEETDKSHAGYITCPSRAS